MGRVYELTAHVQTISRGKGRSATAAAAYRACCAIDCEREGKLHDYGRKGGLEASGIVTPKGAPAWASDRAKLWNAAEMRERNGLRGPNAGKFKADAVTAREIMFAFPAELSAEGRLSVADRIARHLVKAHGVTADYSIHAPGKDGDQRNHHCHLMMTTRRMGAKGLGEKTREWDGKFNGSRTVTDFRAVLAMILNEALAEEGKAALVHVEHRSFEDRGGVGIKPTRHQGPGKSHELRNVKNQARQAWHRQAKAVQEGEHAKERLALRTRQGFALAAISGDFTERERRGVAAIRDELAQQQAGDVAPSGMRRFFQIVSGGAMRADFERQARATARTEAAEARITALKQGIRAEHAAYATAQLAEAKALDDRHRAADRHLAGALSARVEFDRAAEVQFRRDQVQGIAPARTQNRGRDMELSP